MKNAKQIFSSMFVGALLVGCGDYRSGEQSTVAEGQGNQHHGSATDVVAKEGYQTSTNELNTADNGIGGPMQRESGNYREPPKAGQNAADEELARKVRIALTTGSMGTTGVIAENQLTKIQVAAQNGSVTLTGPVASEEEKETVGKQVAGMKGVTHVNNQLTVGTTHTKHNATDSPFPRTTGNE